MFQSSRSTYRRMPTSNASGSTNARRAISSGSQVVGRRMTYKELTGKLIETEPG
jgi:hypothetical protein